MYVFIGFILQFIEKSMIQLKGNVSYIIIHFFLQPLQVRKDDKQIIMLNYQLNYYNL